MENTKTQKQINAETAAGLNQWEQYENSRNEMKGRAPESQENVYSTENAQLFADYFKMKHAPDGTLTQLGAPFEQSELASREIANYELKNDYYNSLINQGYAERDVALMASWDSDETHIPLENQAGGNKDWERMVSVQYADQAWNKYQYDKSMYERYVNTAKTLSKEQYDPNGDGHYNLVESILDEFATNNDDEIREVFEQMDGDQRRMLAFDGVHNEDEYLNFVRSSISELHSKREAAKHRGFWGEVGNFFKSLGHGIVSGLLDIVKIPTTIVSLGAALVNWSFDNPISRAMGEANKTMDDAVVGGYDKAVGGVDLDSWSGKIGNITGQAVEIAAEAVLTAGVGPILTKGVARTGEKAAQKAVEKAVEHGVEKVAETTTEKIGSSAAARAIEKSAEKLLKKVEAKTGEKVINRELLKEATEKVLKDAGSEYAEKAAAKAAIRLSKRGMLDLTEKELEHLGLKAAQEAGEKVVEKTTEVATKEVTKEVTHRGAQHYVKKLFNKSARTSDRAMNKALGEGNYKLIEKMMQKPTGVSKALNFAFGRTDGLTKLFAIKSFANQVNHSQELGDNPMAALARAMFAYGTTNAIWGRVAHGNNPISKMINKYTVAAQGAEKSVLQGSLVAAGFLTETIKVASLMTADGSLQGFISDGMRTVVDENGQSKFRWGIDILKEGFSTDKIFENFVSAFTMNITGASARLVKTRALKGLGNSYIGKEEYKNSMVKLDEIMSNNEYGLGSALWEGYKQNAKEQLGDSASEHQVIDAAADIILKEGGSLSEMVIRNFVRSRAASYGMTIGRTLNDIEISYNQVAIEINEKISEKLIDEKYSAQNDIETNNKFREFVELAMMDNANLFEGQEIPEDLTMNNYQPEDFVIAHAIYRTYGEDLTKHSDKMAGISKAFKEALELKKDLGVKRYNTLMTLSRTNVASLASKIKAGDNGAKKYVEFIDDIKQQTKGINKNTEDYEEKYRKALSSAMSANDIDLQFFNNQNAEGNHDASNIISEVKRTETEVVENAVSVSNDEQINVLADEIVSLSSFAQDKGTGQKDKINMSRIKTLLDNIKKSKDVSQEKFNLIYKAVYEKTAVKDVIKKNPDKYQKVSLSLEAIDSIEKIETTLSRSEKMFNEKNKNQRDTFGKLELTSVDKREISVMQESVNKLIKNMMKLDVKSDNVNIVKDIWKEFSGRDYSKDVEALDTSYINLESLTPKKSKRESVDDLTESMNRLVSEVSKIKKVEEHSNRNIFEFSQIVESSADEIKKLENEVTGLNKTIGSIELQAKEDNSKVNEQLKNLVEENKASLSEKISDQENKIENLKNVSELITSYNPDFSAEERVDEYYDEEVIEKTEEETVEEKETKEEKKDITDVIKEVIGEDGLEELLKDC